MNAAALLAAIALATAGGQIPAQVLVIEAPDTAAIAAVARSLTAEPEPVGEEGSPPDVASAEAPPESPAAGADRAEPAGANAPAGVGENATGSPALAGPAIATDVPPASTSSLSGTPEAAMMASLVRSVMARPRDRNAWGALERRVDRWAARGEAAAREGANPEGEDDRGEVGPTPVPEAPSLADGSPNAEMAQAPSPTSRGGEAGTSGSSGQTAYTRTADLMAASPSRPGASRGAEGDASGWTVGDAAAALLVLVDEAWNGVAPVVRPVAGAAREQLRAARATLRSRGVGDRELALGVLGLLSGLLALRWTVRRVSLLRTRRSAAWSRRRGKRRDSVRSARALVRRGLDPAEVARRTGLSQDALRIMTASRRGAPNRALERGS